MGDWIDFGPGGSDGGDGVVGVGADAHVDAFFGAGAAGGEFAVGVGHGLEASGGDGEREGDGAGEGSGCGVDAGDVDEDAGAETVFGESSRVFVDSELVGGAGVVEF